MSYEGFVFGRVADIRLQRDEHGVVYAVELTLEKDWKIPGDSVARVHSQSLLADTVIDIAEGESNQFLEAGGTLHSALGIDLFSAIANWPSISGISAISRFAPCLQCSAR